jgi:hypothetical protein
VDEAFDDVEGFSTGWAAPFGAAAVANSLFFSVFFRNDFFNA